MSQGQQMIALAGRATKHLGAAADRVAGFVEGQLAPDGGFRNRAGKTDLYYTFFGLHAWLALRAGLETSRTGVSPVQVLPGSEETGGTPVLLRAYLTGFGEGATLDLIHLSCLVRCRTALADAPLPAPWRRAVLRRLEEFRADDGGYGSLYAAFMAGGAYDALGAIPPGPLRLLRALEALALPDGSYANDHTTATGSTPATAGMMVLRHATFQSVKPATVEWLLARATPDGGFSAAAPPIPDLVSTAAALYALHVNDVPLPAEVRQRTIHYIESLWHEAGGFSGHVLDETPDCEYTFHALLSLGCLVP